MAIDSLFFAIALIPTLVNGLDNGAARKPPLGWQSWNGFGMNFNATLFLEMAKAMADPSNGLLESGYKLMSVGGSTYKHQGLKPWYNGSNESNFRNVIVRNSTGYYQVDPGRFPGPGSTPLCLNSTSRQACLAKHHGNPEPCGCVNGNEGMASMIKTIKALGFQWGSYSNEAGCEVEACNISALNASRQRGFVDEDADLFFNYWDSDYVMVDSVGSYGGNDRPYPKSDARWWKWERHLVSLWSEKVKAMKKPIVLHSCHSGCGSRFTGPTLILRTCNASDPHQLWSGPPADGNMACVHDAGRGLCICCNDFASDCANDAARFHNGSGYGLGMGACAPGCGQRERNQQWNISASKMLRKSDGSCLEPILSGIQVVSQQPWHCNGSSSQQWNRVPVASDTHGVNYVQLASVGRPGQCLAAGPQVQYQMDSFCAETVNMWRSSTDTLQVWGRLMAEVESLVGMGNVSGPGHWAFADSLELGVPGGGVLTWEESKSHLALYAITSQPLFVSNDVRSGYTQKRLLDMLKNKMMLSVNQEWAGFAGDRMWTSAVGKEIWSKPLPGHHAAVLVFNRNGTTSDCSVRHSIDCPCDDNITASIGSQDIYFDFSILPSQWLRKEQTDDSLDDSLDAVISCDVIDIFGGVNASDGVGLGRVKGGFKAEQVPPHGSRFLLIGNCTDDDV